MSSTPVPTILQEIVVAGGLQTGPFGSQLKAAEYCESGVPVVMPQDIRAGRIREDSIARVSEAKARAMSRHALQEGDVVFARRGDLGKIAVVERAQAGWLCGTGCLRVRLDARVVSSRFMAQYMKLPQVVQWMESHALGVTMLNLNTEIVGHLPVVLPPLNELRAIEDVLAAWDAAILRTERLRQAKARQYSFLVEKLTVDAGTGAVHIRSLTAEESARNGREAITLVLSVTNKSGFELPEDRFSKRVASDDLSGYKVVRHGQYAYNPSRLNVGSIGRLDEWDCGVLSPMYVVFSLDETKIESDYFRHWLRSSWARGHIVRSTQGSVRDSVGFSDLGSISIHLPTLDIQRRAVQVLNASQLEIDLLAALERAYGAQKAALASTLMIAHRAESKAIA